MLKYFYLDRSMTENIIDNQEGTLEQAGEGKLTLTNYWKQCCHIGRYIADWATFLCCLLQKNCLRYILFSLLFGRHLQKSNYSKKNKK